MPRPPQGARRPDAPARRENHDSQEVVAAAKARGGTPQRPVDPRVGRPGRSTRGLEALLPPGGGRRRRRFRTTRRRRASTPTSAPPRPSAARRSRRPARHAALRTRAFTPDRLADLPSRPDASVTSLSGIVSKEVTHASRSRGPEVRSRLCQQGHGGRRLRVAARSVLTSHQASWRISRSSFTSPQRAHGLPGRDPGARRPRGEVDARRAASTATSPSSCRRSSITGTRRRGPTRCARAA